MTRHPTPLPSLCRICAEPNPCLRHSEAVQAIHVRRCQDALRRIYVRPSQARPAGR